MKSLFSYLIVIFDVMYWIFRVIVSLLYAIGMDFICQPLNENIEIGILFLTIPCIIFIIRRNVIVTTLYFGMYAAYFGTILYNSLMHISAETESLVLTDPVSIFITALGVVLPFLTFCDVAIQKSGYQPEDIKTDWYYENEKYDRELDERADKNHYKIK